MIHLYFIEISILVQLIQIDTFTKLTRHSKNTLYEMYNGRNPVEDICRFVTF